MTVWSAIVGGIAGTLVLTTILRAATEFRLTRMDLPFLLGTVVTSERTRAKVLGYLAHFGFGIAFAMGYLVVFRTLGSAGLVLGAALGLLHGVFAGTALVNELLPLIHPRMGSAFSSARMTPLLEAPGFMMRNYGRGTPVVGILAHVTYGMIVGLFVQLGT
jgi:hypothetical protein